MTMESARVLGTFGSRDHNNSHVTPSAVHGFTIGTGQAHGVLSSTIYTRLLLHPYDKQIALEVSELSYLVIRKRYSSRVVDVGGVFWY